MENIIFVGFCRMGYGKRIEEIASRSLAMTIRSGAQGIVQDAFIFKGLHEPCGVEAESLSPKARRSLGMRPEKNVEIASFLAMTFSELFTIHYPLSTIHNSQSTIHQFPTFAT